ncbi:MAG: SH3 domain-containing protein [Acidimicrobiia bacterium]|nr:SH3 domain-containing protein [Acidimicrobiia bacterium]
MTTQRSTNTHLRRILVPGLVLALVLFALSACSDDDPAGEVVTDTAEPSPDTTADDGDDGTDTSGDSGSPGDDSNSDAGGSDGSNGSDDNTGDLPGESWDGFAAAGDLFGVVGVAHDDVLNVRAIPDASADIITALAPTATGIVATGEGRLLPSSIWYQVDTDAGLGWVNARYVAFIAGTDDATAEYLATGSPGGAETMVELADMIADAFILDDSDGTEVVQTVAPTVGDLGEITYDIIGLGDDAVAGFRLHILATPSDSLEGFDLTSIERTYLCSRGTDGEVCF